MIIAHRAQLAPLVTTLLLAIAPTGAAAQRGGYDFDITRGFLTMSDGVQLAVTWYMPRAKHGGEHFPALLEFLPYRKDDSFYQRDYPLYSWFARRGFLMAKVDVRGTGGSGGALPPREYSTQELADATEIIAQLTRHPASNGKVGMWGISSGGFNSLMMAARGTPGLGAIIALHASDDLYHDDVHYVDGIFHLDPYQLEIDHENGLPRTPDYPLDSAYFADRFDRAPWIMTNLAHPVDDAYWQAGALRFSNDALRVPSYLIGGLLDGYRDTPPRLFEGAKVPVKVEIGPWEHAWPDNGTPGPDYEWRERAAQWWDHWLRGDSASALMREPRFMAFVRAGNLPDVNATELPGQWKFIDWQPSRARSLRLYPDASGQLRAKAPAFAERALRYDAGSGPAGGDWSGDRTPGMGPDDAGAMVFDGAPLATAVTIVGLPSVRFVVQSAAPLANWIARLEDVAPNGQVSLVTGGAVNGPQIRSRRAPDARTLGDGVVARRVIQDVLAGTTRVELQDDFGYAIGDRRIFVREFEAWQTSAADPAHSLFLGIESHRLERGARVLLLESRMEVSSDSNWLRVLFTRRISENGVEQRSHVGSDSARRDFH